jgi:hypothetical protein
MVIVRTVGFVAAMFIAAGPSAFAQDPPRAAASSALSKCPVAEHADYGYKREQAIEVGGGAMYVAARERRYLDALRGPAGQVLEYKRTSAIPLHPPNSLVFVDAYEVTYEGLEKPVTLYLNAYSFADTLRAPQGFICGTPIALAAPGPDTFRASDDLVKLAVEQGATRQFKPIPLDADGTATHGVILDHFRVAAAAARAAAAAGTPIRLGPEAAPPDSVRQRMVIVAYPLACEGRTIPPKAVDLLAPNGAAAPRQGDFASGERLASLAAGVTIPEGSIAAVFQLAAPRPTDSVRITYAEACGSSAPAVSVLMKGTPASATKTPAPSLPAGSSLRSGVVRLQAQIDLDGAFQRPSYAGGPQELVAAAIEAVKGWRAEPMTLNGAPMSTPIVLRVEFTPAR